MYLISQIRALMIVSSVLTKNVSLVLLKSTNAQHAKAQGGVELIVRVLLMATTMHLFWLIIQLGIANPA